jgi:hypothetical protein
MSSMSHDNNIETRCEGKFVLKSKESSWDENVGGVGGLNLTPHLGKFTNEPTPCIWTTCHLYGEP